MAFTIDTFRSTALSKGGARANLFEVELKGVGFFGEIKEIMFACKAAAIPAMAVATVDVPYFGRVIKVPGNKTFDNWTVTIINDETFSIRNGFEEWIASMGTHIGNVQSAASSALTSALFGQAEVRHYAKSGPSGDSPKSIATYKFENIFPVTMSEITLGWDANDAIEEFTVEFAYDYWQHGTIVV